MVRFSFSLMLAFALCICVTPADAQFSDDFDSYGLGLLDGPNGWQGWGGDGSVAGTVSNAQSSSAPNSLLIGLFIDAVNMMGNPTSGCWEYSSEIYIPSSENSQQYFIMCNQYDDAGSTTNWSVQTSFESDVNLITDDMDDAVSIPLVSDTWIPLRYVIDLDLDTCDQYIDGVLINSTAWSTRSFGGTGNGIAEIGCVDLYSNGGLEAYHDNISLIVCPTGGGCQFPTVYTKFRGNEIGTPVVGDFAGNTDDCTGDGTAASYNPGFVINNTEAPVWLVFDYAAASSGSVQVTSQAGTPNLEIAVEYWDGSMYVEIGPRILESFGSYTTESFSLGGVSADRIRVGWRKAGFTINFPWQVDVDAVGCD